MSQTQRTTKHPFFNFIKENKRIALRHLEMEDTFLNVIKFYIQYKIFPKEIKTLLSTYCCIIMNPFPITGKIRFIFYSILESHVTSFRFRNTHLRSGFLWKNLIML